MNVGNTMIVLCFACLLFAGCSESKGPPSPDPAAQARRAQFSIVNVFDFGRRGVRNFLFVPVTRRLYVSFMDTEDDLLYEWDVDSGKVTHEYKLGKGYMCDSVAAPPDGKHLVVGCWPLDVLARECKTLIINTAQKRIVKTLDLEDRTSRPKFSADGTRFWADDRDKAFDLSGRSVSPARYEEPEVKKESAWCIESSKDTIQTHGLYWRDASGKDHRLTQNEWNDNFCVTKDKKFVITTTRDGELIVWRTTDRKEVYRRKLATAYGFLAYDADRNRVLLGDALSNGTTFLRALVINDKESD